jgi:hypothetical protein
MVDPENRLSRNIFLIFFDSKMGFEEALGS